jgi:hypothetical protein
MAITGQELIVIKRRLARSFSAKARQWRNREYLPFVDEDRRHSRILALSLRAKQLKREIAELERYSRHGAPGGREL